MFPFGAFTSCRQANPLIMAQKEFILCAAVNYKGIIVSGYRHGDCADVLKDLLSEHIGFVDTPERKDQGFLTSHNRFVDRKEAFVIAKANNQIWHKLHDGVEEGQLTSEDLYYNEI